MAEWYRLLNILRCRITPTKQLNEGFKFQSMY